MYCGAVDPNRNSRSKRPSPRLAIAQEASTTACPSTARRSGPPGSDGASPIPIGRYRECTRVAALRAAGRPPPWAITASAANCADPANTSADIAIAPIAEKPAWTASTPKESETTLLANAYGVPARTPAQKDARGGPSWSSPGIRAAPDSDQRDSRPSEIDAPHRRKGAPDSARGELDDGGTRARPPRSADGRCRDARCVSAPAPDRRRSVDRRRRTAVAGCRSELPEEVRARLLHHLGVARSAVRTAQRADDQAAVTAATRAESGRPSAVWVNAGTRGGAGLRRPPRTRGLRPRTWWMRMSTSCPSR